MINLTKKIFNQIKNHSLKDNPKECCGLLVDNNKNLEIFKCKNIALDQENNFSINPEDYLKASLSGKIIAFYHSHCSEKNPNSFSILDKLNSIHHKLPIILYYIPTNEFKIFNSSKLDCEYIGRPFEFNVSDCFTLVRNFYEKEYNILLPDILRNDKWEKEDQNRIINNIEKYGFSLIKDDALEFGDIILIYNTKRIAPSHFMIYLNNNQVLHHRFQGYSTIEHFGEEYRKQTYGVARYNKFIK